MIQSKSKVYYYRYGNGIVMNVNPNSKTARVDFRGVSATVKIKRLREGWQVHRDSTALLMDVSQHILDVCKDIDTRIADIKSTASCNNISAALVVKELEKVKLQLLNK